MTFSAHEIAAELRRRHLSLRDDQIHALLYYCQGHHLAFCDELLFEESIRACESGPVIPGLRDDDSPPPEMDNGVLNTIGYVLSRYGTATTSDLRHMTRAESPWRMADAARCSGGSDVIGRDWMRDYFRNEGAPQGAVDMDMDAVHAWLKDAKQPEGPGVPDDMDRLRAWATHGQ